ncbi:MAG TPA: winged helix-turn-helix domain-containing protein [Methanobacterium sp.]|nr:winged helix-turn-helix domain-containing protein [Methanobacterium sp.]
MRRSKTDIAEEILRVAMQGANKTQIVNEAHINFNIASRYLEMLNEKELIMCENRYFITTSKGKFFQETAKKLRL